MDRNQDPAFPSCSRVLLWERQFFFPTDHNCSTLTLQCKLHLKEGIQLHNISEQKANNTSHIYDYINDILPVSQEIYNTQSVSAERKGSKYLWDFYKLWNLKIDIYETVNWKGVTLELLHCQLG